MGSKDSLAEAYSNCMVKECLHSVVPWRGSSRKAPLSIWLTEPLTAAEAGRRQDVLRRACDKLIVVSSANRPRTIEAFARFVRPLLRVRSHTVRPADLLPFLDGVSVEVAEMVRGRAKHFACPPSQIEAFPERRLVALQTRWARQSLGSTGAQVRWIEAAAFVECTYGADTLVLALHALGLVKLRGEGLDCSDLSVDRLCSVLPLTLCVPERDPSPVAKRCATFVVQLPKICMGAFFGKGGVGIRETEHQFLEYIAKSALLAPTALKLQVCRPQKDDSLREFCPGRIKLQLLWSVGSWQLEFLRRRETSRRAVACAKELAAKLKAHVTELYLERLEHNAERRQQRTVALEEVGRRFHEMRRMQQTKRQEDGGALRALDLPPAGIRCKMTAGRGKLAQRRRADEKEKRKRMLRANAVLESGLPAGRSRRQVRSDARRMLRQAKSCCDKEVVNEVFEHVHACSGAGCRERQHWQDQDRRVARRAQRNNSLGHARGERHSRLLRISGETSEAW